jgi:hypothetical protein
MMTQTRATFTPDREAIIQKFSRLLEKIAACLAERRASKDGVISPVPYFEVRASALNLLARTAGESSIYYRELHEMDGINPGIITGILTAAMTDYREGFMADAKLLVTAEVFADFLVQAEVLLEHGYKDAAAVVVRAVLEDGLRRVCIARGIAVKDRDGVHQLAEALTKLNILTAVQFKEIEAKKEVGNNAAHGKFTAYTKADVVAFHEFVQRLLAILI